MSAANDERVLVGDLGHGPEIIPLEDRLIVGREEDADLTIAEGRVSRRHAEFHLLPETGELCIEDLGSSNGTFVNDLPVFTPQTLSVGDVVRIGSASLTVALAEEAEHLVASAPAPAPARKVAQAEAPQRARAGAPVSAEPREPREAPAPVAKKSPLPLLVGGGVAVLALVAALAMGGSEPESPDAPNGSSSSQQASTGDGGSEESTATARGEDAPETVPTRTGPDPLARFRTRFESALSGGEFARADTALARLGNPDDLGTRLDEAMTARANTLTGEFESRRLKDGIGAASTWLNKQLKKFPITAPQRMQLDEFLFAVAKGEDVTAPIVVSGRRPSAKPASGSGADDAGAGTTSGDEVATSASTGMSSNVAREKLDQADTALAARKMADAGALYQEVLEAFGQRSANELSRRSERGLAAIASFEKLTRLLVEAADAKGGDLGKLPWETGRQATLSQVNPEGIRLVQRGETMNVPWRLVPADTFVALAKKLRANPAEMVTLAGVIRRDGEDTKADELLAKIHRRSPALEGEIFAQLASARGLDEVPEGGFQWFDEAWLTKADLARAELRKRIDDKIAELSHDDAATRAAALDQLVLLGDVASGRLIREIDVIQKDLQDRLANSKSFERIGQIRTRRELLDERRKTALELIFDSDAYPYPYRPGRGGTAQTLAQYQETQPRVTELTALVKEAWDDPAELPLPKDLPVLVTRLQELNVWRLEVGIEEKAIEPEWLLALPKAGKLTVRNFAWSLDERDRIDRSLAVIAANAEQTVPTKGELDQINITNEYRFMYGRWALAVNDALTKASRGHCQDMSKLGFFAHDSPVKGKETPSKRAVAEGYPTPAVGENIAINSGPEGAHNAWIRSPGHHRNILRERYRVMGPGNSGRYWCQLFGSAQ